jgi:hypothetical protein
VESSAVSLNGGPELFCRYAQPPNLLGYCGPDDSDGVTSVAGGLTVPVKEVQRVAQSFNGAWPYLELIAAMTGKTPLSEEVVEAYWIGNGLLDRVPLHTWGNSVSDRFRQQAEGRWEAVEDALNRGGVPNHAFHVFCVYPWVGLLREGFVGPSLKVLDRCRISWGRVVAVGEMAIVARRPLGWDDNTLSPGEPVEEPFRTPPGLVLSPGDIVSLHWDFICDRLSQGGRRRLQTVHDEHLAIANRELSSGRLEPAR